ncbi:uncharacterized mitochondrial protein-like protein [Tanacetum coccineum]
MVLRAVLIKSGLVSINTTRQNIYKIAISVNTARQVNTAHSKTTVNAARLMSYLSKTTHSTVKRPIHKNTTFKNNNINQRVNIVRGKNLNTAKPKAVVNAAKGNNLNAVKALACWVWKPKHKVLDHGNPQIDLQDQGVIDSGCSRHMNRNMLLYGRTLTLSFMRPFGCAVTILNTIDHLGKFDGKADEGTQSNGFAGIKASDNACQARKETEPVKDYILLPLWTVDPPFSQDPNSSHDDGSKPLNDDRKKVDEHPRKNNKCNYQEKEDNINITNNVNAASINKVNAIGLKKQALNFHLIQICLLWKIIAYLTSQEMIKMMIEKEVYVYQPPRFEDPDFPDRVYKVEKSLYGLHQAPRAWFTKVKTASTPMETQKPLLKDEDVCACARYQVNPKVLHLHAVKRIFKYLKGQPKLGLWYPKDYPFDLVAYTDSDYARASLDIKSTTEASVRRDLKLEDEEGVDCLPNSTIFEQLALMGSTHGMSFVGTMASVIICLATNQKFNFSKYIFESMVKNVDNVSDEAIHKELGNSLMRAATTASSLEAEQDSVLDLEKTKTTQAKEIDSLKRRVKKLEKKRSEDVINDIDVDEDITLVNVQDGVDNVMFDVNVLNALEALKTSKPKVKGIVFQEPGKSTTTTTISSQQSQDKAEFDEEGRLAREKAEKEKEASIALIEE